MNQQTSLLPQNQEFWSPPDGWEIPLNNCPSTRSANTNASANAKPGTEGRTYRSLTEMAALTLRCPSLPPPFPNQQTTSTYLSPPKGRWSVDSLKELSGVRSEEHQRAKARISGNNPRMYSDQDIRTRSARASLTTQQANTHKRAAASYPIWAPSSYNTPSGLPLFPPFLPFEHLDDMKSRPQLRYGSTGSVSTRSSFESGHTNPLTVTSSAGYASSRSSLSFTFSNPSDELHARMPPRTVPTSFKEPLEFPFPPITNIVAPRRLLMTPQRFGRRHTSPAIQNLGLSYQPQAIGEGFKRLPEEILLGILAELKKSHLAPTSVSCSTCYMRDLVSTGASCKKWWSVAKTAIYEDIQLNGEDPISHMKKRFKIKHGSRLKLLRRTLQARPDLAEYVKSLKVPTMPETAKSQKDQEEYMDLVASVIMACPNLERFPGMTPTYKHEFSKFTHALSTRKNLKERVWNISGNSPQRQYKLNLSDDSENLTPIPVQNSLLPDQCVDFLGLHSNWFKLQTLVMHCNSEGIMNSELFTQIFASLPSLEKLHISSFPASAFDDTTLLSLPALPSLKALRLENLPGVTDDGLSDFAAPTRMDRLTSLSLISLSLHSLPVLARLFSHLKSLTEFTLSQAQSPPGVDIFLYPYLASSTLKSIHWEFTSPDDDKATEILAKSITHSGFPALTKIRAPTDFEGKLQKLCRPRDKIELPGDKYRNVRVGGQGGLPAPQSTPTRPTLPTRASFGPSHSYTSSIGSSFAKSPTRSAFSLNIDSRPTTSEESSNNREQGMSLAISRRLAQRRAEAAKAKSQFHIIIWDENGELLRRHAVGGFLGQLSSSINYVLEPDLDGSDDSLMGIDTLLDGLEGTKVRDGCTGSWNADMNEGKSSFSGKKSRDRWVHTERGRWKDVSVNKLF